MTGHDQFPGRCKGIEKNWVELFFLINTMRTARRIVRGTQNNGGTSAHQPSESSDSPSTHNFRGGDCECKQTLCLSKRSRIHPKRSSRCRSI